MRLCATPPVTCSTLWPAATMHALVKIETTNSLKCPLLCPLLRVVFNVSFGAVGYMEWACSKCLRRARLCEYSRGLLLVVKIEPNQALKLGLVLEQAALKETFDYLEQGLLGY
mmetsp:Transcript_10710/g.17958  ORF Transcript_10710/g.17958 Transcript_10710/m.17958 type:complete len:113 (-) Transcript_10710:837-1175(-)